MVDGNDAQSNPSTKVYKLSLSIENGVLTHSTLLILETHRIQQIAAFELTGFVYTLVG
jgi:hypothetical protein